MKQLGLFLFLVLSATASNAQEPCEEFLQALRERGYHDVALDYLEEMESSPLSSSSFKASIPFEKAQTLISSTSRVRDLKLLNERLEQAEQLLAQAEADSADPNLKARAQDYRGDLLFRRARSYLNLADNDRLTDEERKAYRDQAKAFLEDALDAVTTARSSYKKLVDEFEVDLRSAESRRQRKMLRATFTSVLVKRPQVLEMYADSLEADDDERNTSLKLAAREFEKLWDAYPTYAAGLDSCFFGARCNHKLGRYEKAIELLKQIFALEDASSLVRLKLRSRALAAECWANTSPYPFDDVIANLEPFAKNLSRRQQTVSQWQRIQLELARAYHAKASELKKQGGDTGRIKSLDRDAAKLIKALARVPGEHRDAARQLSLQWNVRANISEQPTEVKPVNTFADAKEQGADLLTEVQAASSEVALLKRDFRSSGESDSQLKQQVAEAEKRLSEVATSCLQVFDRALNLAGTDIAREDVNQIRYSQCACRYLLGQYFEAAIIGEFLVERYPTVPFSRQSAGIALRSYSALYDGVADQDKAFERQRLSQLAEKTVATWPGSAESNYAASTLAKVILGSKSVSDEEIDSVKKYIAMVSDTSDVRSLLNVKLGNKLWFKYKNGKAAGEAAQQLSTRLQDAIENLNNGLGSYNSGNLTMEAAWGAQFKVDALLEANRVEEAIQQLEQSAMSPLKIVERKPPMLAKSKNGDLYIAETYKIAGKAYLAAMGESPNESRWIEKASQIVRAMSQRAAESNNAASQKEVNNMFRLIAFQMQRQFDLINDDLQLKSYAENMQQFLTTIQSESKDPSTLIWAGRTLLKLGDAFEKRNMRREAKPLFKAAIGTLEKASSLGATNADIANDLKRQQALAKRGLGEYEAAFNDLKALLKESPSAWNIQIDAAETLQRWGENAKQSSQLARALSGTEKYRDPKTKRQRNLIWGWSRLVSALKTNPRYREPYYRCLFAEIETRLVYGLVANRSKAVQTALDRLEIEKNKDSELGGVIWKKKFSELESRLIKNGAVRKKTKNASN